MTDRRTFIAHAIMAGAGLALGPVLLAAVKEKKVAGLQLYTLRDQLRVNPKEVIAQVAKAGFKEVEVFGYDKGGFFGLSSAEFNVLLRKHRLTSPSGHYDMGRYFKSGKLADLNEAIEVAKVLEHRYITIPSFAEGIRKTYADVKDLISKINEAALYIQRAGLKLAYHNHDFELIPLEGTTIYEMLLKGTEPGLVDFEMDLYWIVRAGQDPVEWFKKYPGRFKMVHVKDMSKDNPKLNTEVGSGCIDFKQIFAQAQLAGIKHYILEQENFKIDPYESIFESCKYFLTTLAKN